MIVFPALHLENDPDEDVALALHWAEEGASWIHIDLPSDVALGQRVTEVLQSRGVQVQVSKFQQVDELPLLFEAGVARVVMPSDTPINHVEQAVARWSGDKIVATIEVLRGSATSAPSPLEVARELKGVGITRIVYREAGANGSAQRVNIAKTGELAQRSGLKVIAAGAVGSLDDLLQVRWLRPFGVEGVIVEQGLKEGRFSLREALETVRD